MVQFRAIDVPLCHCGVVGGTHVAKAHKNKQTSSQRVEMGNPGFGNIGGGAHGSLPSANTHHAQDKIQPVSKRDLLGDVEVSAMVAKLA